jgi:hypothetical protein
VGLERRVSGSQTDPQYYVLIEYAGRTRTRPRFDEKPIIKDIGELYRFLKKNPLLKPD